MIVPNTNIPRWIKASVAKHFETVLNNRLDLFIEGEIRDTNEFTQFVELRLDGPFIRIPQKDIYIYDIEVNALIQTFNTGEDNYLIERNIGITTEAFQLCIPIYKYGDENTEQLGVLRMRTDRRESLDINNFGMIHQDTNILQATIEAHYRLEFKQVPLSSKLNIAAQFSANLSVTP